MTLQKVDEMLFVVGRTALTKSGEAARYVSPMRER